MLLSTFVSKEYKKFLVNCILICGAFQAFYGICQSYNWLNVKLFFHKTKDYDEITNKIIEGKRLWVLGLTNNPNFFGTYMLLCLSYSLGLFIDCKKVSKGFIYVLLIALFMYALLLSNTTSAAVGLIVVGIFILIYCIKNKFLIKFFTITAVISVVTFFAFYQGKTRLIKDIGKVGAETTEIAKGNLNDSYGTDRMFIWKKTVEIIPKHIWHGVGVDSFHKAFDGGALTQKTKTKTIIYDKAHNEYLQILVTEGIFAFISYLLLYGTVLFSGLRRSIRFKEVYLVLPVIGYLVQAFFNISVIEVAPMFFMALGLCCGKIDNVSGKKRVVLTYGTFDLLHYGHIRLLERAKKLGDYLIVAVSTDEFNKLKGKKAFYDYETRKKMVEALRCVDLIIPEQCWEQKIDDIKKYKVDIVVMGSDWKDNEKFESLKDYCKVVYLDRTDGISSSRIKVNLDYEQN